MAYRQIKKVLISDKVDSSCERTLLENGFQVVSKPGMAVEELLKEVEDVDALIVRSATKVTADVMSAAKNLKLIGRAGTGVDNIDVKFATQQGIVVMNTPGGNTLSAAEHTCALIAALSRSIPQAYSSLHAGKWERSKFMGMELNGKTLGIVGLGRIGKEVAHRMQSYGMKTVGFDPIVSKEDAAEWNIEYMQLEELFPIADFITVHTPLIPQTKGLLRTETFGKCKKGVRVINVARGGIIDEEDLLVALESGQCGGAALDVFVSEPPKETSFKLVQHPNVIGTPHLGASTIEAQLRVAREIAEQISDLVKGIKVFGALNAPALELASKPDVAPWISLADKLGSTLNAINDNNTTVTVKTGGECIAKAGRVVLSGVSIGLVKAQHATANIVNAASLAEQIGIKVTVQHDSASKSGITLSSGSVAICGTVMNNTEYLTHVNGQELRCPMPLMGSFLFNLSKGKSRDEMFKSLPFETVESISFITSSCGDNIIIASCKSSLNVDDASKKGLVVLQLL